MIKYTHLFVIFSVSLSFQTATIATPIPIKDLEHQSFLLSDEITENRNINHVGFYHNNSVLDSYTVSKKINNDVTNPLLISNINHDIEGNLEELTGNYQMNSLIYSEELRQSIMSELFQNESVLDGHDLASYQDSLNELINISQIIPMQLAIWKTNIDSIVYSNSDGESNYYQLENYNNEGYYYSDWGVFFNSIYFYWIKIFLILTIIVLVLKDFIRNRRLKKSKDLRTSRRSSTSRRSKLRRRHR